MKMARFFLDISMSLDGFVAGPNATLEEPLGEGGERLHDWVAPPASWREPHGLEGGETTPDDEVVERERSPRSAQNHGPADVQRRRGPVGGRPERRRLVGRRSALPRPVFVLTHHARETVSRRAGRRSRSSPTGSSQRSSRPARPREKRTSHSAAARTSCSSICGRAARRAADPRRSPPAGRRRASSGASAWSGRARADARPLVTAR